MILHKCIEHDLRKTFLDFGSIGEKSRSNFDFKLFTICFTVFACNSISFWHTMMILNTCIKRPQEDLCWFWGEKSWSYFDVKLCTVSTRWPHFFLTYYDDIMGSSGQRYRVYMCIFHVWTIDCFRIVTLLPFDIQLWYFTHVFPMSQGRPPLILWSRGQG